MRTLFCLFLAGLLHAADNPLIPTQLSKDEQMRLAEFVKAQAAPKRYVPENAKFGDTSPSEAELKVTATKDKPIRQYTVQITPHRPVPGAEAITKADIVFYRPNPEKGKPGLTVRHTVDLATGKQIGETEVLTAAHTPISREELEEAVASAKADDPAVKALYAANEKVKWEYLQMKINRKSATMEPGDRVVRIVFKAGEALPLGVLVNLTKNTVLADER